MPSRVICPHCAQDYPSGAYKVVDVEGNEIRTPEREGFFKKLAGINTPRQQRIEDLAAGAKRLCPNTECAALLSSELFKRESRIIAVVGQTRSSKTAFIAAAVHQWRTGAHMAGIGISYNQFGADEELESAITRMFDEHQAPGTTFAYQAGQQHKVVVIVARTSRGDEINLVFVDVSGEDLANEVEMARAAKFISRAEHVFVLITPMVALEDKTSRIARAIFRDTNVVHNLTLGPERSGNTQSATGTLKVINGLMTLQGGKTVGGNRVGVSVLITKADMLRGLFDDPAFRDHVDGVIPPPNWLTRNSDGDWRIGDETHGNLFQQQLIEDASRRTRELLKQMNANLAINIEHFFSNPVYFAVSASGGVGVVQEDGTEFHDVRPYRCVDPFLHMLTSVPALRLTPGAR